MKKLIWLAVLSLVLPAFYSGCLGDSHMEPAVEAPPPEGAPLEGAETPAPAETAAPVDLTLKIESITGDGNVEVDYGVSPAAVCMRLEAPCTYTITEGTSVTLKAVPLSGYFFSKWSGDMTDSVKLKTFVMEGNMTISAKFSEVLEPRRDIMGPTVPKVPPPGVHLP